MMNYETRFVSCHIEAAESVANNDEARVTNDETNSNDSFNRSWMAAEVHASFETGEV
jgi:hypothetical protein